MENKKYTQEEISQMIKKMESETLQKFILEKAKDDEAFRQSVGEFLDHPATIDLNCQNFERSVRKALDKAFQEIEDEWGHSEYSDPDFIDRTERILKRIRKESPEPEYRISLQIYFLRKFDIELNYEETETFEEIIQDVIDDFETIFREAEEGKIPDVRRYLCYASLAYLNNIDVPFDQMEYMEDFVIEYYSDLLPTNIEDYIAWRIASTKSSEKLSTSCRDNYLGRYVCIMLDLLSKEGKTEEELRHFARKYWKLVDTRQWLISHFQRNQEWDKAVFLLEKSLEMDREKPGLVKQYEQELKKLYPRITNKEKLYDYRESLVTAIRDSWCGDIEKFRELKSLCTPEQWMDVRERILRCDKLRYEVIAMYLNEEELYDRLADLVLDVHMQYHIFDGYASKFPSEYNDEILAEYQLYYQEMASSARRRVIYEDLMAKLTDVHRFPGGKELTDLLTREWLDEYRNRPAFIDEIQAFRSMYHREDVS